MWIYGETKMCAILLLFAFGIIKTSVLFAKNVDSRTKILIIIAIQWCLLIVIFAFVFSNDSRQKFVYVELNGSRAPK